MRKRRSPNFIVYDIRAVYDPDSAVVHTVEFTRAAAIRSCRDQGQGAVYDGNHLTFWLDGGKEWDAYKREAAN